MPQPKESTTVQPNSLVQAFEKFLPKSPTREQEAVIDSLKVAELTVWHNPERRANQILGILADFRNSLPEDVRKSNDFIRIYNGAVLVLNNSLKRQ